MSGLESIDETKPLPNSDPKKFDDELRALKAALNEYALVRHYLSGELKIPSGSLAQRPTSLKEGDAYILQTPNVEDEFQRVKNGVWETLTKNQILVNYIANLLAHKDAAVIDHPNESVTSAKIDKGAILKSHLDDAAAAVSIKALVDGSNADALHVHGLPGATLKISGNYAYEFSTKGVEQDILKALDISIAPLIEDEQVLYFVVASALVQIHPPVILADDFSVTNLVCKSEIINKLSPDIAKVGGVEGIPPLEPALGADYTDWGDYFARITLTGNYQIEVGSGVTITIKVYYYIFELTLVQA